MSTSNKNDTSNYDDGIICEVNGMLQNISIDKEEIVLSVCANCGKEGNDVNNTCNKCKQVKYCNAACKKKHRHKHKKDCEEHQRLAAEHALSYMMRHYLNNHHQKMKIVQFVFYECLR